VVDTVHGVEVPDPYRWLESGEAPEVQAWVAAQNERTRQALDARPDRARWHERLVALMGLPVVLAAEVAGDRLFVLERAAGAEQASLVLRSATDPTTPPRVLVDPTAGTDDAAVAVDWFHPSFDGRLVAYGTSEGGNERSVLRVLDVDRGEVLVEEIPDTRACSLAWWPDGSGFWYTRYPSGEEYHRRVFAHRLGEHWRDDELVFGDLPVPHAWPTVQASPDGRYLLVEVMVGWAQIELHLLDCQTGDWRPVITGVEAVTSLTFAGERLVGVTTLDAPRGRVVAVDPANPAAEHWVTVLAEGDAVLRQPVACGDEVLVVASERAVDRILRLGPDGERRGTVDDLGLVSIVGLTAERSTSRAFVVAAGFTTPTAVWRWTPAGGIERWCPAEPSSAQVPELAVRQARYASLDGTEIGMFLVHRAERPPGPGTPALLTGYGGFALTESPAWSPLAAAWCAAGGLYALSGLRGGAEEGEAWHEAGRRANKQNVFDDFAAAADWLVAEGLTSRERLALHGGSNGGLLMGAALTQHPDLARAVWCAVPLLDMVRFPQFLIARLWTDEYGDPAVPEELAWLLAYSPYHRVVEGTCYPAVLLTTAEGDSRVDPLHARKMAAMLQWASSCADERPVLLHQEGRAGHGVGKPAGKRAAELADVLAFFTWQLDLGADRGWCV
jgi:prolyl oligopeptidase